ncbi:MAG: hypothetical protein ABIE74_00825 [Pseudomonadota bacterium]
MVDRVVRGGVGDSDLRARLEKAGVIDELAKGNIHEVLKRLPGTVSIKDVEQFLASQLQRLERNIWQDKERVYSLQGEPPPPSPIDFKDHDKKVELSSKDREFIKKNLKAGVVKGLGKAVVTGKAVTSGKAANAPMTEDELHNMVDSTIADAEQQMRDIAWSVAVRQFDMEYQRRNDEIIKEIKKLFALAKSGKVDAVFLILALTKVKMMEDGKTTARLGMEMGHYNEEMNRVSQELYGKDSTADYGTLQLGAQEMKDMNFNMEQMTMSLNKQIGQLEEAITFAQDSTKNILSTRREIINRVGSV